MIAGRKSGKRPITATPPGGGRSKADIQACAGAGNRLTVTGAARCRACHRSWLNDLRDLQAIARINVRIRRLSLGNPGDVKPVGEGVSELRIDYGPGYRIYFVKRGGMIIILLYGGDKRTQQSDIAEAKRLSRNV
jgi:putative addiction module killer protein